MMGARDMQRYIILKSIKNAKTDKDLEKYLLRAKVNFIHSTTDCPLINNGMAVFSFCN